MCGDVDEQGRIDEELFERFLSLAARHGVTPTAYDHGTPDDLTSEEARKSYMNKLFKEGLNLSLNEAAILPEGERMDGVAGQALVFARLAGFLAGQLPPEADLFRTVIGAVMEGYREPTQTS